MLKSLPRKFTHAFLLTHTNYRLDFFRCLKVDHTKDFQWMQVLLFSLLFFLSLIRYKIKLWARIFYTMPWWTKKENANSFFRKLTKNKVIGIKFGGKKNCLVGVCGELSWATTKWIYFKFNWIEQNLKLKAHASHWCEW